MTIKISVEGTTNYAFQTTVSGVPIQTAPIIDYTGIKESVARELFWGGFKLKMQTILRTMKPEDVRKMFATGKTVSWRECLSKTAAKEKLAVDSMSKQELAAHIAALQARLENTPEDNESNDIES